MRIRTNTASGAQLNWLVAAALGFTHAPGSQFNYSTDWALAGPILESAGITVAGRGGAPAQFTARLIRLYQAPGATVRGYHPADGPTYLIAAMRCFVASRLGAYTDVPSETRPR